MIIGRRRRGVVGVIVVAALALLTLATPAAGHSQLVTSTPGSGESVAAAPKEARLLFSEPVEPGYTSADLLNINGKLLGERLGSIDPSDARVLVVPLPVLPDGAYSLGWRAISAADGHGTQGFVTFAIGATPLPPGVGSYDSGSSGDIHSGHSGTTALAETQGRAASYLGWMLALGLALVGLIVVRPVTGSVPKGLVLSQAGALLVAGLGSGLLALTAGESFSQATSGTPTGTASALDSLGYLLSSRIGVLLLARIGLALAAAIVVFVLARQGRARIALAVAGVAGMLGIGLTVAGSHAAAFDSVGPVVAQGVHMASAGVWLAGIVALAGGLATGGLKGTDASAMVPRFSALALVSIGLLSLTGTYAMWLETGQLLALDTGYATVIDLKIVLFLAAAAIGALNYLERPRALIRRLPFLGRVSSEAALAVTVVIATALLASGSPPAGVRPIDIAPAAADVASGASGANGGGVDAAAASTMGIQPARPGPNRFTVRLAADPPTGATVQLRLQRLDADQGLSTLSLVRVRGTDPIFGASGGGLPATSRWDATVIVTGADGAQLGRRRFGFALDATGISEGRTLPPLDPALAVAMLLLALGILGLSFAVAGGRLPRTDRAASRVSLLAAGSTAVAVGILLMVNGPHR